jgi:hypothetical protein
MTRNRIKIACPLPEAIFPAASDATNLMAGRPAPESMGVVELSTALAFAKDIELAKPG